jgi:DNA-binding transcriptional regulator YiaG
MAYNSNARAFERLKAFMNHHGLKRDETAKKLSTSIGTFKHWLTGQHQTPGVLVTLLDILENIPAARRRLGVKKATGHD